MTLTQRLFAPGWYRAALGIALGFGLGMGIVVAVRAPKGAGWPSASRSTWPSGSAWPCPRAGSRWCCRARAAAGAASITMSPCVWRRTASSCASEAFSPLGTPPKPTRTARHNPYSIASLRHRIARMIMHKLDRCPYCAQSYIACQKPNDNALHKIPDSRVFSARTGLTLSLSMGSWGGDHGLGRSAHPAIPAGR